MPAPSHAPATAAPISRIRVRGSTGTIAVKTYASAMADNVCPTFKVPGIRSSGTMRQKRNAAVVVAKFPMPNASKKSTTNPTTMTPSVGLSSTPVVRARLALTTAPARTIK